MRFQLFVLNFVIPVVLLLGLAPALANAAPAISCVPPANLAADGQPRTLTVIITDENGGHLGDAVITWTHAKVGILSEWAHLGGGFWSAQYAPAVSVEPYNADVIVDISYQSETFTKHFTFPVAAGPANTPTPPEDSVAKPPVDPPALQKPVVVAEPARPPVAATTPTAKGAAELAMKLGLPELDPCGIQGVDDAMLGVLDVVARVVAVSDKIDAIPLRLAQVVEQSASCVDPESGALPTLPIRIDPLTFRVSYDPEKVPDCLVGLDEAVAEIESAVETLPQDLEEIPREVSSLGPTILQAGQSLPQELLAVGQELAAATTSGAPVDGLLEQQQKLKDAQTTVKTLMRYLKETPRYLKERKEALADTMAALAGEVPRGRQGRATAVGGFRRGRLFVRYPFVGYSYNQVPGVCAEDLPCPHFTDAAIKGPDNKGMLAAPGAFSVYGEFFPIEFVGLAAAYEVFRFNTTYKVIHEDGTEGTFGDAINRVWVGARFRLPLLGSPTGVTLDVIADAGYQGQDFLYFETSDVDGAATYDNVWADGLRFGGGGRLQAIPGVEVHADWHGTVMATGLISSEVEAGVQIQVYKTVAVDLGWLLRIRSLVLAKQYDQAETASASDLATGVGISAGAVF